MAQIINTAPLHELHCKFSQFSRSTPSHFLSTALLEHTHTCHRPAPSTPPSLGLLIHQQVTCRAVIPQQKTKQCAATHNVLDLLSVLKQQIADEKQIEKVLACFTLFDSLAAVFHTRLRLKIDQSQRDALKGAIKRKNTAVLFQSTSISYVTLTCVLLLWLQCLKRSE